MLATAWGDRWSPPSPAIPASARSFAVGNVNGCRDEGIAAAAVADDGGSFRTIGQEDDEEDGADDDDDDDLSPLRMGVTVGDGGWICVPVVFYLFFFDSPHFFEQLQ